MDSPLLPTDSKPAEADLYTGYREWKGWEQLFRYSPDRADYFAGETRGLAIANADVLEIGFGAGAFLQWAADHGARIAATEINAQLVRAAAERGIEVIDPGIERIAAAHAGRFDTIVAFDVFEHFTMQEVIARLAAAEKMLKTGGHLLMRFPNAQSPFGLVPQHGDPTHRSYLSKSVFEQLIQQTSFEVVRYDREYRARGRTPATYLARLVRGVLRDAISFCLNLIYATRIPYDAVVVLVLRKMG